MKKRITLMMLVLIGVGSAFFINKGEADPNGVPTQIERLQATVDSIKDSINHIDPTIIGNTTLTTGMLWAAGGDWITCGVVNVSETKELALCFDGGSHSERAPQNLERWQEIFSDYCWTTTMK